MKRLDEGNYSLAGPAVAGWKAVRFQNPMMFNLSPLRDGKMICIKETSIVGLMTVLHHPLCAWQYAQFYLRLDP
jgi:hypothetical protein